MPFKPVESLSEQIASHLANNIIRGEITAGERIQELRIAGELEVSRGSVREALLILERRHLVDILPRRGAVVTQVSVGHVKGLYQVYAQLLGLLARGIAENWSGSDLDPLIKKFELMRTAKDRGEQLERIFELGFDIMELAYPIVDNPYLSETLTNFKPMIQRTYFMALQSQSDDLTDNLAFFGSLMDAVVKRDADRSAELISDYVGQQLSGVLKTLEANA
ncbi:GntR family transcriptional regulator [Litoribrevibacter albus]|uniref:GntR family transcriptional regulator n=1 Tax=Litoribrevibacter albus TaxID=1473156 RepID=A0AA37W7B0_9GAMM|nr:GntR family transcriptional regulator [Litoribrevibacter albus]GLQ32380.1 GntR family transcriptional regulator [Litoribrevibacter albus]